MGRDNEALEALKKSRAETPEWCRNDPALMSRCVKQRGNAVIEAAVDACGGLGKAIADLEFAAAHYGRVLVVDALVELGRDDLAREVEQVLAGGK